MRVLLALVSVLVILSSAAREAAAYKVYFTSGDSMEAESHRVEGGKVYLKVAGGEAAFNADQIDLERTIAERNLYLERTGLAERLMQKGDTSGAAEVYYDMVGPETSDMDLLRKAAETFVAAGRFDDAIAAYKRMQELAPETPGIRTNLGDVYYRQGKYYDAIDQYLIALDEDSRDKKAHLGLGMCYARQEMYEGAKTELNKAIEIYPEYAEAFATLGYVYYKMSAFDNADRMLAASTKIDDTLPEAHYYMGLLYGLLGVQTRNSTERINYIDKSIESFRRAVTLRKFYPEAHADLGVAYYSRGSVARAIEEFNLALTQKPDMAVTHSNLAGIYNHRGFYKEAAAEAQAAVSIDPKLVDAYMIMGNAYANMRDFRNAAIAYDKYLYHAPSGPLADEAAERLKWVLQEGGLEWPLAEPDGTPPPDGGV